MVAKVPCYALIAMAALTLILPQAASAQDVLRLEVDVPDGAPPAVSPYCVANPEHTVRMNIVLDNIQQPVMGANINLEWDPNDCLSCWEVIDISPGDDPGMTFEQFGTEDTGPGYIRYSVTRPLNAPAIAQGPVVLAYVVFKANPQPLQMDPQHPELPWSCCVETLFLTPGAGASATKLLRSDGSAETNLSLLPVTGFTLWFDSVAPIIIGCGQGQCSEFPEGCLPPIVVQTDPGLCVWNPQEPVAPPEVIDNCQGGPCSVVVYLSRRVYLGEDVAVTAAGPYPVGVTCLKWCAVDCCGNETCCWQKVVVQDKEAPVIVGEDVVRQVNSRCQYTLEDVRQLVSITDNCTPDPQVQQTPPIGTKFGPGEYDLVINANDSNGNNAVANLKLIVVDATPPVFTCGPGIDAEVPVVYADAGKCTALVCWEICASDNCGTVSVVRQTPLGSGDLFPIGQTQVSYKATDAAGNESVHSFQVTVLPYWLLDIEVELKGYVSPGPFTWCVAVELLDCDGVLPFRSVQDCVVFTKVNGKGKGTATFEVPVAVPCNGLEGDYECARAKAIGKSLWEKSDDVSIPPVDRDACEGEKFLARFVGDDALRLGNVRDDMYIDLLDWFVWQNQFLNPPPPADPNPPDCCAAPPTVADITGDGLVTAVDFGHLYVNNFAEDDEPCVCIAAGDAAAKGSGPVTKVSVLQLKAMGLDFAAAYDANGDGYVDVNDMVSSMRQTQQRSRR